MNLDISSVRHDYAGEVLDPSNTPDTPLPLFRKWIQQAIEVDPENANAMTLATVDSEGKPHARVVLLKGLDESGLRFFTNYQSHKGQQLEANLQAALVFWWPQLARQVRVEGRVEKVSNDDSDHYFHSRPVGSQIGAIASPQSQVLESRDWLAKHCEKLAAEFKDETIPRPNHWGGYQLTPTLIEFWQGQPSRLHDRVRYEMDETQGWKHYRLAP